MQATNRDKWPPDAEDVRASHPRPQATTLLDHEKPFWDAFVVEGRLDIAKLESAGYSAIQAPWLTAEMKNLGWL